MIKKNVIIETPAYQEADIEALKRTLQWCKKQKTDKSPKPTRKFNHFKRLGPLTPRPWAPISLKNDGFGK